MHHLRFEKLSYSVVYFPGLVKLTYLAINTITATSLSRFMQVSPKCLKERSFASGFRTLNH